jgi:hypothetical protein
MNAESLVQDCKKTLTKNNVLRADAFLFTNQREMQNRKLIDRQFFPVT